MMTKVVNQPYTSGDWLVKSGQEDSFVKAWAELAQWTSENVEGSGKPHLIQEVANPRHFVSFGPWESFDAVKTWRQMPGFKERFGKIASLCEQSQGKDYVLRVAAE
jgi:heme-degrading monooxygenase HmoA